MDSQTLVAQLQQIGLWPEEPAVRAELARLQRQQPEARALAKELLSRNLVTPYQVNQILTGKGQGLVAGPYRIEERLGEGASAVIYKARHYLHHRVVALKIIRQEWVQTNALAVDRFFREAQAAAALSHPNVVRAYDVGHENGVYYYAMQFLDGVDLSRFVKKEGPLDVNRACDFILQAARGLQHIHEHGMLHRDVKPSNLMVQIRTPDFGLDLEDADKEPPSGRPAPSPAMPNAPTAVIKILDLGLARLNEDPTAPNQAAVLTRIGTVMGTPDYIAPEQALHSRHADIRSDIYSLGCTFYFALTGRPPFPGGDAIEKMLKHQLDAPTPIATLCPELPAPVVAIVERMMAKKKEDRYQTPQEVVQALDAFLDPPVHAIPLGPAPAAAVADAGETGVDDSSMPPLVTSALVRVPSRRADLGLWIVLGCACVGAIIALIVAVRFVLR